MKNHWPAQHLREVISFISLQHPEGICLSAVSEKIGVSPQAISSLLLRDDTMLSTVEKIAQAYGYTCRLHFPKCQDPLCNAFCQDTSKAGNLADLFQYAFDRNYSLLSLSKLIGCNRSVLDRAIQTGDIKLSVMNTIVNVLTISVTWEWVLLSPIS